MSRIHRLLAPLVPPPGRDWVLAHEAEMDQLTGRRRRWRWALGVLPIAGRALAGQLRRHPRSFLGGALVKTVLVTLSLVDLAAGIGLVVLVVTPTGTPGPVVLPGLVLLVQGGYTLGVATGRLHADWALRLQITGSTLALLVGAAAVIAGAVQNVHPVNGDPEFAPMTIALLLALHGLVSLLAFVPTRTVTPPVV
jgi:hypothetical protein